MTTPHPHPRTAPDPLAAPQRATRRWLAVGACAVPLLVWALWPTSRNGPAPAPTAAAPLTPPASSQRPPIRVAVFDAPIWTLDPPPPAPAAPPPPLRLQLIATVRENGTLKALLYDQDADEIITVAPGDRIGKSARSLASIDAQGVTLSDGRRLLMEGAAP